MSINPEKLERLKQPKSMSMYASQGDMISDLLIDRDLASSEIDRLQRENDDLRPYKDELLRLAEAVGEKDDPFAAWEHLEPSIARAEAAEDEVKRLQAELALSKPLYSRRQIEARVKLLEAALRPFSKASEVKLCGEWRDDERFAQTDVGFHLTFGDLRRARTALASTGGEHHADK